MGDSEEEVFWTGFLRCRTHFARNLQAELPKGSQDMVAAALRLVFVQPEALGIASSVEAWPPLLPTHSRCRRCPGWLPSLWRMVR